MHQEVFVVAVLLLLLQAARVVTVQSHEFVSVPEVLAVAQVPPDHLCHHRTASCSLTIRSRLTTDLV